MKKIVLAVALLMFTGSWAMAQSYNIKEMTPAVKSALDSRKARFADLKSFKGQGLVGEDVRGYVAALGGGSDVKAVVAAENRDRKLIYTAIVDQNGLGSGALDTVEGVFAGVQREKAASGEKYQDEQGDWVTK